MAHQDINDPMPGLEWRSARLDGGHRQLDESTAMGPTDGTQAFFNSQFVHGM
jgi:hypothetical protein